jgi:lipoprotein-anchoring transpeptidase ErfK/SrfK
MWRIMLVVLGSLAVVASVPASSAGSPSNGACASVADAASVAGPASALAWRIGIENRIAVFNRVPGARSHPAHWLSPSQAPWLLVVGRAHSAESRCWLRVQLPWRPNNATGWINASNVVLEPTRWRIVVSTARRTLTLFRAGVSVHSVPVVIGKPSTPTPHGRFAVVWAIRWHPRMFLGSWVLELTAHSNVLQRFDGGDGTVAIHGRGGTSLLDPLSSALSHGCIRLSNASIDWLVRTVGARQMPGTPVDIT